MGRAIAPEPNSTHLGRAVSAHKGRAPRARAADIEHHAVLARDLGARNEERRERLRDSEGRNDVDFQQAAEAVQVRVEERRAGRNACVVDEHVEPACGVLDGLDGGCDVFGLGDVELNGLGEVSGQGKRRQGHAHVEPFRGEAGQ